MMMLKKLLFFVLLISFACAGHFRFPMDLMRQPPGGLTADQTPQFVVIGNDDVGYSGVENSGGGGGLHYLTELLASRKNPAGKGESRNFDGKPPHYSFYVNTIYITPQGREDPAFVKRAYQEAIDQGHEIGVHTHSHPHGRKFSVTQWEEEMQLCIDHLAELGVPRTQLMGFRTPFIEYNDHTLTAVKRKGFVYDCSIEEGVQIDADGRNFVWPYQLDHGSPGNLATYKLLDLPRVREHSGLWEIPAYVYIVPPDELCKTYGVEPGLRAKMMQHQDYFEMEQGKITGFDWNLWYEFGMEKNEFVATLKYTLDQHLRGNRCPMTLGMHSDIYADKNPEKPPTTTVEERREAIREFIDYALSKPEVRFVSARELLSWMQSPAALSQGISYDNDSNQSLGAGFRFSVYGPRKDPGPKYWAYVAQEMVKRFPGSTPEAIWIVGRKTDKGTELPFPIGDVGDPLITSSKGEDRNEPALNLFDELGFRVWLQVEPRFASVEKLLHLVLKQYSHHPSIIGVGIDVEWNKSTNPDAGEPVSDEEARAWLAIARSYNPNYRLFLKHWEPQKMPPTFRDGILFVDDSQIFASMQEMVDEFAQWGKAFAPSPVGFQFGYPSDRKWWIQLKDPPKQIGDSILQVVPNTEGLFWVDFSVLEVFPPDTMQ